MKRVIALLGIAAVSAGSVVNFQTLDPIKRVQLYMKAFAYSDCPLPARRFAHFSKRSCHYGFIDRRGKLIIAPKYGGASSFHEGLCAVAMGMKCGYIDRKGSVVIPARFQRARDFSCGLAAVAEDRGWSFIDHQGRYITESKFSSVEDFESGTAIITIGVKQGVIDRSGN